MVQALARDMQCSVSDLMSHADIRKNINLTHYLSDKVGMPTLTDIMSELDKPGRDPRSSFEMFEFDKNVRTINDVQPGMVLPGIVTNITNFGCFVDIGVHQDGLIHVSNMADHRINNPHEVVHLNQKVMVRVIGVETDRKRISLSLNLDK